MGGSDPMITVRSGSTVKGSGDSGIRKNGFLTKSLSLEPIRAHNCRLNGQMEPISTQQHEFTIEYYQTVYVTGSQV